MSFWSMRAGAEFTHTSPPNHGRSFRTLDLSLRLTIIPLTAASLWVMAANKQATDAYGKVEFSNITGLKYLVLAYLMVTSGAAATEVVYLAYQGDTEASWSEGCSYYGKFCNKAKVSLSLHFVAFVCFIALSLVSAYRVFSKLEAPFSSTKEVGEQMK